MGTGRIALVNTHTNERVSMRYRREDGSYDDAALARIRRVFRSSGDDAEGEISLRLVEILSRVQQLAGGRELMLVSGYRSPSYNEGLRAKGVRAAGGSLHTEGLAADVAFPRKALRPLWMQVRGFECCGAGFYEKDGFLHVDVGRPRFWEPATSRVEENLSAGNARMFARTEFDRYAVGEVMVVHLHAVTLPPVRLAAQATVVVDGDEQERWTVAADLPQAEGCWEAAQDGMKLRIVARTPTRSRVSLATCEPRLEKTPSDIETNLVDVRYGIDHAPCHQN